jgi:signal transduction histidine kinase
MDARWLGQIREMLADATLPPAPRPHWLRRGRVDLVFAADVLVALICFAATTGTLGSEAVRHHNLLGNGLILLVSFLLCAPLVLRTRFPLTAWSVSAIAMLWASSAIPDSLTPGAYIPAGVIVYVLCLYAVAVRCRAWVVASAVAVTVAGAAYISPTTAATAIFTAAAPVFIGVIVRSRRGSREQLEVAERRHESERALLEERQRIARELHDVVAHHMSVIAIQAEAAPYKTADPPEELVESFAQIRASALSGLNELRRVLGVLRSSDSDTAPQPGLDDLAALLESARKGGVTVTADITGNPRLISAGVDLSAYRIVQEALSNAMRHAPGSAVQVNLYYGETALVIEVRNSNCPAGTVAAWGQDGDAGPDGGHGIIGMQERATMLGGHLNAGPTGDGEFLVTAALPLGSDHPEGSG